MMEFKSRIRFTFLFAFIGWALISCTPPGSPEQAIEAYIKALVDRDTVGTIHHSCISWEEQANAEASSFGAVEARIEGMRCQTSDQIEAAAVVTCVGTIVANYDGEDTDINLDARSYNVILEDGEWRMCGYR